MQLGKDEIRLCVFAGDVILYLEQRSPRFLAPQTSFKEENFSTDKRVEWNSFGTIQGPDVCSVSSLYHDYRVICNEIIARLIVTQNKQEFDSVFPPLNSDVQGRVTGASDTQGCCLCQSAL